MPVPNPHPQPVCRALLQTLTGDAWSGLMGDAMLSAESGLCTVEAGDCGTSWAIPYFISFQVRPSFPIASSATSTSTPLQKNTSASRLAANPAPTSSPSAEGTYGTPRGPRFSPSAAAAGRSAAAANAAVAPLAASPRPAAPSPSPRPATTNVEMISGSVWPVQVGDGEGRGMKSMHLNELPTPVVLDQSRGIGFEVRARRSGSCTSRGSLVQRSV